MEVRNRDAKMPSSEKPESSNSSVRSSPDSSKSPKKPIILGVVNPLAGKTSSGNILRKRRWDQPPENDEKNQTSTIKTDKSFINTSSAVKIESFLGDKTVDNKVKVGNLDSFKEFSGSINKQLQGNESVSRLPNIVETKAVSSSVSPENTSVKPLERVKLVRPKHNIVKESNVKVPEKSVSILERSLISDNNSNTKSAEATPSLISKDQKETGNSNSVETPQLKSTALMMISSYDDSPSEDSLPEMEIESVQDLSDKFESVSKSDPLIEKNKSNIDNEKDISNKFSSGGKLEELSSDGKKELVLPDEAKCDVLKNFSNELTVEEQMEKMFSMTSESPPLESLVAGTISNNRNNIEECNIGLANLDNECSSSKIKSVSKLIEDYDIFVDNSTDTEISSEQKISVDKQLITNSEERHLAVENIDPGESEKRKMCSEDVELESSNTQQELDNSKGKCMLLAEANHETQIEKDNLFHTEVQGSTDFQLNQTTLEEKSLGVSVDINNELNLPVTLTEKNTIGDKLITKVESELDVGKIKDCKTESVIEDSSKETVDEAKKVPIVENIEIYDENVTGHNTVGNEIKTIDSVCYSSLESTNSKHSGERIEKNCSDSELEVNEEVINSTTTHKSLELMEETNKCEEIHDKSSEVKMSDKIASSKSTALDLEMSECNKQNEDSKNKCHAIANEAELVSEIDSRNFTLPQTVQDCKNKNKTSNINDTRESERHSTVDNKLLAIAEQQPHADDIKQSSLCSVESEVDKHILESKNDDTASILEPISKQNQQEEYQESDDNSFCTGKTKSDNIKKNEAINFKENVVHEDKVQVCEEFKESKANILNAVDVGEENLHVIEEIRVTEELNNYRIDENIEEAVEEKLVELENIGNKNIPDDEQEVSDVAKSSSSNSDDKTVNIMKETHSDMQVQSAKSNVVEENITNIKENKHEVVSSSDVSKTKRQEYHIVTAEKSNIISNKDVNINEENDKITAIDKGQSDTNITFKCDNKVQTDNIVSDECITTNEPVRHEIICSKTNQNFSKNISKDGKQDIRIEMENKKKLHEGDSKSSKGMMELKESSGEINKAEFEKYDDLETNQIDLGDSKDKEEHNELKLQEHLLNNTESSLEKESMIDDTKITDLQNIKEQEIKDVTATESEISLEVGKTDIDNLNELEGGSDSNSKEEVLIPINESIQEESDGCDIKFDDREQHKFKIVESVNAVSFEEKKEATKHVELFSLKGKTDLEKKNIKNSDIISILEKQEDLIKENDEMYDKNKPEKGDSTLNDSGSGLEMEQIIQTCETNEHDMEGNAPCEMKEDKAFIENTSVIQPLETSITISSMEEESFEVDLTEKEKLISIVEDEKDKDIELSKELPEVNEKLLEGKLSREIESKPLYDIKHSVAIAGNDSSDYTQNSNEEISANEDNLLADLPIECRKSLTMSDTKDILLSCNTIGNTSQQDVEDKSVEINIIDGNGEKEYGSSALSDTLNVQNEETETVLSCETSETKLKGAEISLPLSEELQLTILDSADEDDVLNSNSLVKSKSIDILLEKELLKGKESNSELIDGSSSKISSVFDVNVLDSNTREKNVDFQDSNKEESILNNVYKLEEERTQDMLQSILNEGEYNCEAEPSDTDPKKEQANEEKFENTKTELEEHLLLQKNVSIQPNNNDKLEIKSESKSIVEKQLTKLDEENNVNEELLLSSVETSINKKQTNKEEIKNLVESSKTKIDLVAEDNNSEGGNPSSDLSKIEIKAINIKEIHSLESEIMPSSKDKSTTQSENYKTNENESGIDNDTKKIENKIIPVNKEPEIILDRLSDSNRNEEEKKGQDEAENKGKFTEITFKSKSANANETIDKGKCEKENITQLQTSFCAQIEEAKEIREKPLFNENKEIKVVDERNEKVLNTETLSGKIVGNNIKKDEISLKSVIVNDKEKEFQETSDDSSKKTNKCLSENTISVKEKNNMVENTCEQLQEHKNLHSDKTKTDTATDLSQKTKTVLSIEPVENTTVKRMLKRPFQSLGKGSTSTSISEHCKSFESVKSELLLPKRTKLHEDKSTNKEADEISAKITDGPESLSVSKDCVSETKQETILNETKGNLPLKTKIILKKPEEQKLLKLTETKTLQPTKDMLMKSEKYKGITIKPVIIPPEQSGSSCKTENKSPKHSPKSPITLSKASEKVMLPQTKLEPITLKLSKENPVIMRSQSLSPKTSSDNFKIQDSKAQSVSPQSKSLGYTLKIGKDSTQIIPKDTSGAPSTIKNSEFAKVEHLFKNTGLTITPVVSQEQQESQKLNKITLKLSKAGGHPEIKCEDKCDTWKTVKLPGVDIVPVGRPSTTLNHSANLLKRLEDIETNIGEKRLKSNDSSSDFDADPSSKLQGLLTKALPVRMTDPSTSSAAHMSNLLAPSTHSHNQVVNVVTQGKPPIGMPRKRGRPRKVIPPVMPGNMGHEFKLNDMRSDSNMSGSMFPVPLFNLSEPFMETDPQNLFPNQVQPSTGRPQRSCRGRIKLPIVRTRKPRGGGILKGITRGRGRGRGMKQMLAELMLKMRNIDSSGTSKHDFIGKGESVGSDLLIKKENHSESETNSQGLANLKSIENFESLNASKVLGDQSSQSENIDVKEESKEWLAVKMEAEKQLYLEMKRSKTGNRGRQIRLGRVKRLTLKEKKQRREAKRLAQRAKAAAAAAAKPPPPQMVDEETRMSATESNSRAHTPARTANGENPDESMGSDQTSSTNRNKKGRMEVIDLESGKELTVDQVAEYQWPLQGGELYMIQEQISNYLGVKSFKRKYPDLKRRQVEPEERTYLCDSGLVAESVCDLGLTALSSAEVLDIMYQDFQDKYEDFRKHMREKQAKEMTNKQKAEKRRAEQGQSRMDSKEQAIQSAVSWNQALNKARQETRRCALDLQTWTVQFPQSRRVNMTKPLPKIGNYPVALIPGQYCDYFRGYTPQELRYFPINTVLYGPMKPNERQVILAGGSDGSQSESEDSSSSEDSSDSSSDGDGTEDEEKEVTICKLCGHDKSKPRESLTACVHCSSGITNNTSAVWG